MFVQKVQRSFIVTHKTVTGCSDTFTPTVTLGKGKRVTGCSEKRPKNEPRKNDSQASVFASVRRQIAKWQRHQTKGLRELREQKHFEVQVNLKDGKECIPVVECLLCKNVSILGNKNGSILISNWTCHVAKCISWGKTKN